MDGERIDIEVRFEKPMKSVGMVSSAVEAVDESHTKVISSFNSEFAYPKNLLIPLMKSMLLKDMEKSLDNLKAILEK